ncbi:dihydrofolate reductase [Candidatus Woesearchaeota archaeon]|nr:dihydrofolate reductase [Candidatus Woesearchaeota archaeon]
MLNQISIVDKVNVNSKIKLQRFSKNKLKFFSSGPKNKQDIIERIGKSDCILIGIETKIDKYVLKNCKNLKYICVCGTNLSNIDINETIKRQIIVSNVKGYCETSTAEYIFTEILNLAKGFNKYKWRNEISEIKDKTLGIIGLGAVGQEIANIGLGFGMNIVYFSKTRKYKLEKNGIEFVNLKELLKKCDIISLNVPPNTFVLSEKEFDLIKDGVIFINTSLGKIFDKNRFIEWIKKPNNFAIFDSIYCSDYKNLDKLPRVICRNKIAAFTYESKKILTQKIIDNIQAFTLINNYDKKLKNKHLKL